MKPKRIQLHYDFAQGKRMTVSIEGPYSDVYTNANTIELEDARDALLQMLLVLQNQGDIDLYHPIPDLEEFTT